MCQTSNFSWQQGKSSCGSLTLRVFNHISNSHKMITWSYCPRVSSSLSFFFYAFHQTAGRAEAGLLATRAPCHRLSLKGNLTIILFTSIRLLHTPGRKAPTHSDIPTNRLALFILSLPPTLPPLGSGPQEWCSSGLSDLLVAFWTQTASHNSKAFLSVASRGPMQRPSCFPSILQLKKVPLIALFLYRERCNNSTAQSRICCSSSVFFFSLSLSGHGGEWEHKNVSVYAQNYQTLLLFHSCLPQPVISTDSPHDIFCATAWCARLTPPIKAIKQKNTSCTSVVILV